MKVSAIICEFNPLHTGHQRIINYAKSISDKVICIMSGNFVQRGMPACAEKHLRASHAVMCGADLVIELPTIFSCSSAQDFATAGVAIAEQLQADYLVFGSESGDIIKLKECAEDLISNENLPSIKEFLAQGMSYPKAIAMAHGREELKLPNNILAIEYLKAIRKLNAKIEPTTIKREGEYDSVEEQAYCSSHALRQRKELRDDYSFPFVTKDVNDEIEQKYKNFASIFMSTQSAADLSNIVGISEGIENRLITMAKNDDFDTYMSEIKTKRYTWVKLQRIILCAILNITKKNMEDAKIQSLPLVPLAANNDSLSLLQRIPDAKPNNTITTITQKADRLYQALSGITPPVKLMKIKV